MNGPLSNHDLHFGHFAAFPEYRETNRRLIRNLFCHLPDPFVHVDLATGTGLVPQLLQEEAQAAGARGTVIGIDHDPLALEIARATTPDMNVQVIFLEGDALSADEIAKAYIPARGADGVSIHDAIHEIGKEDDQQAVYDAMARIVGVGGVLSSNSSFTTVAMDVGNSRRAYGEWKLRFMRLTGATRNRHAEMLAYRAPEDYTRMIQAAGFDLISEDRRTVPLSREALSALARYPAAVDGFARDLEFPEELSMPELSASVAEALGQIRFNELPRVWHDVIARKVRVAGSADLPSPRSS